MNKHLFIVHRRLGKHAFAYIKKLPTEEGQINDHCAVGLCSCGAGMWRSNGDMLLWGDDAVARTLLKYPHLAPSIYEYLQFMRSYSEDEQNDMLDSYEIASDWEILRALQHYGMGKVAAEEYLKKIIPEIVIPIRGPR